MWIIFGSFCFLVLVCVVDAPHMRRDASVDILPVEFIGEAVDWLLLVSGETAMFANVSFGEVDASLWVTPLNEEGSDECMGVFVGTIAVGGVKTAPWTESCLPDTLFTRSWATPNKIVLQWTMNFAGSKIVLHCL